MAGFNALVSEIIYEPLQIKNKSSKRAFFMEACDGFKMRSDTSEWQKRSRCIFKTSAMSKYFRSSAQCCKLDLKSRLQ